VLRVSGLRKSYGSVVALAGVDLDVAAGEICCLLGANGAGKTTLVSVITGLRMADDGEVWVNGIDALANSQAVRQHIGFAPQELGVYPTLRVRDNLKFFGELADLRGRELVGHVDAIADTLELSELMDRAVRTLSGGEKRRLHTAVAMIGRPALLLLDEPTTGVDVHTRARLLEAVRGLADAAGTAICYSTHYLPEVEALGASVAIIDDGRIIARGAIAELVNQHAATALELVFDGSPPRVAIDRAVETLDDRVRIYSDRPAADAAAVLTSLGDSTARLRSIEIISPSLESVFVTLTGRTHGSPAADTVTRVQVEDGSSS